MKHLAELCPWVDPVVDCHGHAARSPYVERFWLPVLGPTATLALRRFALELDLSNGRPVEIDLMLLAAGLGVAGPSDATKCTPLFAKSVKRLDRFGLARVDDELRRLTVRRWVPDVPRRHVDRWPHELQHEHADVVDDDRIAVVS